MIGSLISAGANLIGGLFGKSSADKAAAQNMQIAQQNMQMQKDFAQQGIRWKVEDAKAAGIHPVYALGAPTTSFSPISFSATADNSMANAISRMGSDVGGAIDKTRTTPERQTAFNTAAQALTLEKGALENEVLRSQLARIKQANNPPMPVVADKADPFTVPEASKSEERPPLMFGGNRWLTNPNTSPMKAWEDQYGDDGWASWVLPPLIATNDAWHNLRTRVRRGVPASNARWGSPKRGQSFFDFYTGRR